MRCMAKASLICALIAMLSGCSLRESRSGNVLLPTLQNEGRVAGTGVLYIDDIGAGDVKIFRNGSWREVGTITDQAGVPRRNWVDAHGNFYVTSDGNTLIAEFPPRSITGQSSGLR